MNEMEYALYQKCYDQIDKIIREKIINTHIYIRTEPERCLERIKKRGRKEE